MCCTMAVMAGARVVTEGTSQIMAAVTGIALRLEGSVSTDGVSPAASSRGAASSRAEMTLKTFNIEVVTVATG